MKALYLKQCIDPAQTNGKLYIVVKAINTVYYTIDQTLTKETVTALCNEAGPGAYKIVIS